MRELLLRILSRLTGAYNKDPDGNIGKLFSIFAYSLSDMEDTLRTISNWRDIDQAEGATLDRIGKNFGVSRSGAPDALFRLMIKTKVTALLSGGDVDTIINAVNLLFGIPLDGIIVREVFPARVQVLIPADLVEAQYLENAQITTAIIKRIIAAGIGKDVWFYIIRSRTHRLYSGFAVRVGRSGSVGCEIPTVLDVTYLTDENGNLLEDEAGNRIID